MADEMDPNLRMIDGHKHLKGFRTIPSEEEERRERDERKMIEAEVRLADKIRNAQPYDYNQDTGVLTINPESTAFKEGVVRGIFTGRVLFDLEERTRAAPPEGIWFVLADPKGAWYLDFKGLKRVEYSNRRPDMSPPRGFYTVLKMNFEDEEGGHSMGSTALHEVH